MSFQHAWLALQLFVLRRGRASTLTLFGLIALGCYAAVAIYLRSNELVAVRATRAAQVSHALTKPKEEVARPVARTPMDDLHDFTGTLLPRSKVPDFLSSAWKTAESSGIKLSKADYRLDRDSKGQFGRINIVMPVVGAYPAIRRYVFNLMAKNPNLALSKFDLKRQRANDAEVEAELHFILFVSAP